MRAMLASAQRQMVMVGGNGWNAAAYEGLQAFAEGSGLPVAAAFRRQDLFDNDHPLYAGVINIGIDPALTARVRAADTILAIGTRLDDITTSGYAMLESPRPQQRLIHVYPDAEELGRCSLPNSRSKPGRPKSSPRPRISHRSTAHPGGPGRRTRMRTTCAAIKRRRVPAGWTWSR